MPSSGSGRGGERLPPLRTAHRRAMRVRTAAGRRSRTMLPFGRPDLEQTRRMRNARHPDLFLDHRGCMECGAGTPYAGIRTPSETASRRNRAGHKTQCRTPSAETRTPSRTASRRNRAGHKTRCRTPSAEKTPPPPKIEAENTQHPKHRIPTSGPARPPSGVPKRRTGTGPDAATGRNRPVRPKQRPRPKPKSRSRSISAGYLATAYRGSAAGPRAYTRKTERGIRMHELPSLRFTPAVTTATPVRSPPKRSPRLRRPRSWAQPSL